MIWLLLAARLAALATHSPDQDHLVGKLNCQDLQMHAHHLQRNNRAPEETSDRRFAFCQYMQHGSFAKWFEVCLLTVMAILAHYSLRYHCSDDVWYLYQLASRELQGFLSKGQILYQMGARYE